MQLGTVRNFGGHDAVRVDGDELVRLSVTLSEILANDLFELAATESIGRSNCAS